MKNLFLFSFFIFFSACFENKTIDLTASGDLRFKWLHVKNWGKPVIKADYVGEIKDGIPNGQGRTEIVLSSGEWASYQGSFKNGYPEGNGVMTWGNGTIYSGKFKAGKYDGVGDLTVWNNETKTVLSASFEKGSIIDSEGVITNYRQDGSVSKYSGPIANGIADGKGKFTIEDKSGRKTFEYEGEFKKGQKEGKGVESIVINNQVRNYEGDFAGNIFQGQGKLVLRTASNAVIRIYEGQFKQGLEEGPGTLITSDKNGRKIQYQGDFLKGMPHGKGKLQITDKEANMKEMDAQFEGGKLIKNKEEIVLIGIVKETQAPTRQAQDLAR
jgi:hypothetical protein